MSGHELHARFRRRWTDPEDYILGITETSGTIHSLTTITDRTLWSARRAVVKGNLGIIAATDGHPCRVTDRELQAKT
jgi:hypothetical protein